GPQSYTAPAPCCCAKGKRCSGVEQWRKRAHEDLISKVARGGIVPTLPHCMCLSSAKSAGPDRASIVLIPRVSGRLFENEALYERADDLSLRRQTFGPEQYTAATANEIITVIKSQGPQFVVNCFFFLWGRYL
ncbi:unnamed protein product, partial [Pylaiella littoralis]